MPQQKLEQLFGPVHFTGITIIGENSVGAKYFLIAPVNLHLCLQSMENTLSACKNKLAISTTE